MKKKIIQIILILLAQHCYSQPTLLQYLSIDRIDSVRIYLDDGMRCEKKYQKYCLTTQISKKEFNKLMLNKYTTEKRSSKAMFACDCSFGILRLNENRKLRLINSFRNKECKESNLNLILNDEHTDSIIIVRVNIEKSCTYFDTLSWKLIPYYEYEFIADGKSKKNADKSDQTDLDCINKYRFTKIGKKH
jgi:hypothetical protein